MSTLEQIISKDLAAIWTILTPDERRLVADNFHIHSFKKNQIIYAEKDTPQYLWCLLKGKVKLFKDGMGGRQQILRLYRPIQYFGYRAFFANEPYVSTAAAFEPSQLGAIPMQLVKDLINQNRDLAWFFIHELSKNLGGSDTKIVNLTQKHIRGRLAEAIILLMDNYGFEDDGQTLKIFMAREDLANLSNMTTSNAIRTLSAFCQEHIITVDGRRIKIIDQEALRNISKFGWPMIIAQQKRKENIAEYLLYMWQVEDLIRAYNFDIDKIEANIIFGYAISDDKKKEVKEWML